MAEDDEMKRPLTPDENKRMRELLRQSENLKFALAMVSRLSAWVIGVSVLWTIFKESIKSVARGVLGP